AKLAREVHVAGLPADAAPSSAALEAQILFEMGRYREGAALFDSIGRARLPKTERSSAARTRAWELTHAANALAAAGHTGRLAQIADTVAAEGAASFLGRDHRLHHHVRGLLFAARGRDAEAAAEFRSAIATYTA